MLTRRKAHKVIESRALPGPGCNSRPLHVPPFCRGQQEGAFLCPVDQAGCGQTEGVGKFYHRWYFLPLMEGVFGNLLGDKGLGVGKFRHYEQKGGEKYHKGGYKHQHPKTISPHSLPLFTTSSPGKRAYIQLVRAPTYLPCVYPPNFIHIPIIMFYPLFVSHPY